MLELKHLATNVLCVIALVRSLGFTRFLKISFGNTKCFSIFSAKGSSIAFACSFEMFFLKKSKMQEDEKIEARFEDITAAS